MKNIFLLLIVCFTTTITKAQTFTMVDRFNFQDNIMYGEPGYYFKDTQGFFNNYKSGTWVYTNGNTTLQLRFDVKTFVRDTNFKTDALIGGIRIVKNGVEVLNSLNDVQIVKSADTRYFIYDITRLPNTPDCYNCTIPNQRLQMGYKEPDNDNDAFNNMFFNMHIYYNAQNQPILRVVFTEEALQGRNPNNYDPMFSNAPTKTTLHLPFGTYDFVKVP